MNRPKSSNPWNKNINPAQHQGKQKPKKNGVQPEKKAPTPSELKFKEAQVKQQAAISKHVEAYESSSDDEETDFEANNVIASIVKNYTSSGGQDDSLGRMKNFIQDSNALTCLICISRIRRDASIWSCFSCYCMFHLDCIQRWSKDSIFQQKQNQENPIQVRKVTMTWGCPKCRHDYQPEDIPTQYLCFCRKTVAPKYEPFLVAHSCGEICGKHLQPLCGHKCLLLCHPGPCPPCPVTVNVQCYCGSEPPRTQRCCNKEWSCGGKCGRNLACGKHSCSEPCHAGDCPPCLKKSLQKCLCKSEQKLRDCVNLIWQCEKVCGKALGCGNHNCAVVCHAGDCPTCPLSLLRVCPCGKSRYQLPCTEETPTCVDTCDKLLECGVHTCNHKCHKDPCGPCLETVVKSCRCGLHSKEIQCAKPYFCDTKCKRMKDCNKHPCNRKCCDENCPPCEKPCGRSLNCGKHKCASVCHRGPCYPCNQTEILTCRCGETKLQVPCGRKHKTRPPKCTKLCLIPPDCHHPKRENHRCHFGDCPSCKQVCLKERNTCSHPCSAPCHSAVLVKIVGEKASMPWEQTKPQLERKQFPCPDCQVPMPVTCLGEHETSDWPCFQAKPSSCHRPCGRKLLCDNHTCSKSCHLVENPPDQINAGSNCEICESVCLKERPDGCQHDCPKPCHPGVCPPCKQMLRIRCHCGLTQPYVQCSHWLHPEKRAELQSCGNQCPRNFECGHRCPANCHPDGCPNADLCKKKVKVFCKCKRLKKEFSCEVVRAGNAMVACDAICVEKKEILKKQSEMLNERKKREEELRNQRELAEYQKIFGGKKKSKERRKPEVKEEDPFYVKYKVAISAGSGLLIALGIFYFAM